MDNLAWERDAKLVKQIREDLQNLPDPLTLEDIEAELEAYRAEKRAKHAQEAASEE